MTRCVTRLVCLVVVLACLVTSALAQQPAGDLVQLSTSTAWGGRTSVGMDAAGNFVVVWESLSDGHGRGVIGRRFDPAGNPLGDEFRVNTTTTGAQDRPDIAVADTGEFVVVWRADGQSGGPAGVFARRFDAAGAALGPEFPVKTFTTVVSNAPFVAADPRGGFVIAWASGPSANGKEVFARRWDAAGNPADEFQVNESVTGDQMPSSLGVDAAGNVVVGWFSEDHTQVPYVHRGLFRRFDAADSPVGGEVAITNWGLDVGVARDGGFVVVWSYYTGSGFALRARSFDASGSVVGPDFGVSGESIRSSSVAMNPAADGEFVVVWGAETYSYAGEDWYNFRNEGASFDRRGGRVAPAFTASPISPSLYVGSPDVALNGSGRYVVTWAERSYTATRVLARRLVAGRLVGTVTDAATGAPVSGAGVTAGPSYVTTDSAGRYSTAPPPGTYDITVGRTGYATTTVTGVTLAQGETTVRDVVLQGVPVIRLTAHSFDESGPGGNGNGVVDANERFVFSYGLANDGPAAAAPSSGRLESLTAGVTILQPNVNWGVVPPGGQVAPDAAFEVTTSPGHPLGFPVRLRLVRTAPEGTTNHIVRFNTGRMEKMVFAATGPVDIPDRAVNARGVLEIPVSGVPGPNGPITLRMHVMHPEVGDLQLELHGPDGTSVVVADWLGYLEGQNLGTGCPADLDDTAFRDAAVLRTYEGTAPYVGEFKPEHELSPFSGKYGTGVNGTWRLEARDVLAGSVGRIECAGIEFDAFVAASGGHQEIRIAGVVTDSFTGGPVAGATVKTTSGFSTVTGPDGRYALDVLLGAVDVTVSAAGYASAVASDVVGTVGATQTLNFALSPVVLVSSGVTVDDDGAGGNANGVVDANERFRLGVLVANTGSTAATGVSATLSTSAPGVSVHQAASTYPDIPAGDARANVVPFELQTGPGFVPGRPLALRLSFSTAQGAVVVPVDLATGTTLASPIVFMATGPIPISSQSTAPGILEIPVAGIPAAVSKVVLQLHVRQSQVQNLRLTLEDPAGTAVPLVEGLGSNPGANYGTDCPAGANDTTFDDDAAVWVTVAPAPRTGAVRPIVPLARFAGGDPNGTWKVKAYDTYSPPGTLECARLLLYGYASADAAPPPDHVFSDDFDTGDLSAWTAVSVGNGDVQASAAAAMAGSPFGLEAVVNDTEPVYARDETPDDLPRYRARFHFDPNGFDPGESLGRYRAIVLMALDESPQKRVVQLILRRLGGAYSLRARITLDDGTRAETPFVTITDSPHVVEFDWRKATAPGAGDGSFQIWIDGISAASLNGLQNHDYAVDYVRLGGMVIKPGASGTLFFDRFASRRDTYMGP